MFREPAAPESSDNAVLATNDDATECKCSAVRLGYWSDPHVGFFVRNPQRRPPEIHRGYYARVKVLEKLIFGFLQRTSGQIVSLGAGFDTLFWRLNDLNMLPSRMVEVDFGPVLLRKSKIVQRNSALQAPLENLTFENGFLNSTRLNYLPCDLRHADKLQKALTELLDCNVPVLFLCECVLSYVPEVNCHGLVQVAASFPSSFFVSYEPCGLQDTFGRVMLDNLRARGIKLITADSIEAYRQRFVSHGWDGAKATTMEDAYGRLDAAERRRVERIEMLDECELLQQLLQHYCICWAWKDGASCGLDQIEL